MSDTEKILQAIAELKAEIAELRGAFIYSKTPHARAMDEWMDLLLKKQWNPPGLQDSGA